MRLRSRYLSLKTLKLGSILFLLFQELLAQSGGSDGERESDHEREWWCAEAREDSPRFSPVSLERPLGLRLYGCDLFTVRDLVPELSFAIKIYYKKRQKQGS